MVKVVSARSARTWRSGASLTVRSMTQSMPRAAKRRTTSSGVVPATVADGMVTSEDAALGGGAVLGRPWFGWECFEDFDDVAGGDDAGRRGLQLAGFAEDGRHGGDAGEVAGERLVGEPTDDVAGVIAEHRHAVAVGEERGDDHRAELARCARSAAVEGEHLDESHVQIEVQMALVAGPSRDGEHLGHGEGVAGPDSERLPCGRGDGVREHLAGDVDAPEREVVRSEAASPGRGDEAGQIAGIGAEDRRRVAVAVVEEAVDALIQRDQAEGAAARADEPADLDVVLHRCCGPRAEIDLQAVGVVDLVAEQPRQRRHGRPQLGLVARQPDLRGRAGGAGGAGAQVWAGVGAHQLGVVLDEIGLGRDRHRVDRVEVDCLRVESRFGEARRVEGRSLGQSTGGPA